MRDLLDERLVFCRAIYSSDSAFSTAQEKRCVDEQRSSRPVPRRNKKIDIL